jgi:hypothetical protein
MVYSTNLSYTAFTVPLFDEFMRRIMPGEDWRDYRSTDDTEESVDWSR